MRTEAGKPMNAAEHGMVTGEFFAAYIDWRAEHPSDDIMTELLNVEFEDETGARGGCPATNCSPTSTSSPAPATRPPPG